MAAEAGADFLGTVLVPDTPRAIAPELARTIAEGLGAPLVVVTAETDSASLARDAHAAGASVIQLHGDQSPEVVQVLRGVGEQIALLDID